MSKKLEVKENSAKKRFWKDRNYSLWLVASFNTRKVYFGDSSGR